jgi:OmpA-OmpF porin, OOP family
MRNVVIASFLLAGLPAAALAQTRTTQDYVCALTDECGDEAEQTEQKGNARTSSTRGFSLAKPGARSAAKPAQAAPARQANAAPTRPKQSTKTASAGKTRPTPSAAAGAERRVDLRLTFKLGSAELTPEAMAEARVFAQALKLPSLAARKFVIEGHTDAQGSREYNLDLSQRRARAVADYLASLGVSRDRFEVRGFGFDKPLQGRSAANAENRRVEAVLIS